MSQSTEESSAGSWWGSWLNSAKARTSTVFEAVKKDLDELSSAVRTEASNVGAAIESTLKFDEENSPVETVKKSLSSFFGQVSEALAPSFEDEEVEAILITRDGAITLTGFPKHLVDLQQNDKTYLEAPMEELIEKYKRWLEIVEQDQFTQDRLAKHLASSEILNEKYLSLVPDSVPHMEFWKRYLFKRALLEDAIANAELAEKRAKTEGESLKTVSPRKTIIQTEQPKLTCNEKDISVDLPQEIEENKSLEAELLDDEINWGSEEINCNIELSEEEQTRLLEEYEQEIQEREKRKGLIVNEDTIEKQDKTNNPSSGNQLNTKKLTEKQTPKHSSSNSQKNNKSANNNKSKIKNDNEPQENLTPAKLQPDNESLDVQKDNYNKEEGSSTSDESWEKDFDLNE